MTTTTLGRDGQGRSPRRIFLGVAVCLAALSSQTANAQCTRQNLSRLVDDFLAALSANDPTELSVADDLKFTENGHIMNLGDGLWQTAGEVTFSRSAIDVEQCGTLTQAVMQEDGVDVPTIYGVRLRVNDDAELTDIESYVARSTEFAHNPEGVPVEDGEDWEALLDPSERSSREAMIAAANAYFDMFFDPQGTEVPFATPCDRWENGTRTTRGDCSNMGPAGAGGMEMTHRRFPIVDLEAGIVVGFVLFADSLLDFHMFKMRNGMITQIQSVIGPRANPTGWVEQEPAGAGRGGRAGGPGRGAAGRGGPGFGRGGPAPGQ
jgi:hypothetical protein